MEVIRRESSARTRAGAKLVEVFGADLRSLATFRIVLAILVLVDLAIRSTDLAAHYSDQGILPRETLIQDNYIFSVYSFSLNMMNGQPAFQALIFVTAAVAAVAMLVGYRTRLATFIVWLLVLSIQFRNPLALNAGDILLHLLLFWSIFLPLGAIWSVDRARRSVREDEPGRLSMHFFSLATAGLFMQIAFVYWFTAIWKSGDEWLVDGTALYYTLSNDQLTTQLGSYLLNFPAALTVMTFATLALEALGPFALFSPVFTGPVRTATVAAFMSLHFGIWLTMEVGIFPWISAFCMVCFLPGWFWDTLVPKLRAVLPQQIKAVYQVKRRLEHLHGGATRYIQSIWTYLRPIRAWLVSPPGTRRSSAPNRTTRGYQSGSDAFDVGPPMIPVKSVGEPRGTSNGAYIVALRSSRATNLLALLLLLYVFFWNVTTVSSLTMPSPAYQIGSFLGLQQRWAMFAPYPPKEDGWWVIAGNLKNGEQVDLLRIIHDEYDVREVSYEKPENIAGSVENEKWHKYLEYVTMTEFVNTEELRADQKKHREHFSRYLCRAWNERHSGDKHLESLRITYVRETTLPDYQRPETERLLLQKHSCQH